MAERNILIFADNNSALAVLPKGYSPKVDSALVIQGFWTPRAKLKCGVWLDRVESSANVVDGPSRNDFKLMKGICSTELPSAACGTRWSSTATAPVSVAAGSTAADASRQHRRQRRQSPTRPSLERECGGAGETAHRGEARPY